MTSPYLDIPPRTLAEAMEQRNARAELRRTVRNCEMVFDLFKRPKPRAVSEEADDER